jgi:hypothetical protein
MAGPATHHDAYDERYYRTWRHELPPMVHLRRGNAIDVHHTILPETAPVRPDPALLLAAARPIPGEQGALGVYTLCPHDMFLHSAVHLFFGGEFDQGLRDLFDLHRLALHFDNEPGFCDGLMARVDALELTRPLFYALRYITCIFGTPVPSATLAAAAPFGPTRLLLPLLDALFLHALWRCTRSVLRALMVMPALLCMCVETGCVCHWCCHNNIYSAKLLFRHVQTPTLLTLGRPSLHLPASLDLPLYRQALRGATFLIGPPSNSSASTCDGHV